MGRIVLTTRDDFENWLASLTEMLDDFLKTLPQAYRSRLDYSPASLDVLEAWILDKYPDAKSMLAAGESERVNGLACYIGETFRKSLGGKWTVRLDDPQFAYHGLPILIGSSEPTTPECPLTLATAAADRRTGNYLRTVFEKLRGQ